MPRPKMRAVIDRDLVHRAPGRIIATEMIKFADPAALGVTAEIIEPELALASLQRFLAPTSLA
ncbi:hypothetical protein QA640_20870 [Bradyrhizobium sp. CB82]|uniref:hypothetical protein n=1 Tax=Bradyrhizobium sp. CB82 TaxID=3039159 RepID=UPI0024B1F893|nr:hypothetical protein [Bradyrhizobium sp. CB82]WFU44685.1 hypothetical protein QA640_20870 [Bradyrhizobium sp. CB82]